MFSVQAHVIGLIEGASVNLSMNHLLFFFEIKSLIAHGTWR